MNDRPYVSFEPHPIEPLRTEEKELLMSPVGHSLVGLTFATIAAQPNQIYRTRIGIATAFIALASLPDWPLPNWGHDRYDISHSIFVNLGLVALTVGFWKANLRFRSRVSSRTFFFGIAAWLSHLLLDSFYNHGRGVAIFWPLSDGRLKFPIPWFSTLDLSQPIYGQHNMSVFGIELLVYSPLLLVAIFARKRWFLAKKQSFL